MTIDLDKLDAVATGGHSHLLQCIEGFADGYFGSADEIDASHAEHFAKDLVESIEWEDETLCLVEARVLSAVVAELREARIELSENEAVMNAIRRQRNKAELANERVRELHVEQLSRSLDADGNPDTFCDACGIGPFPCPTITALDGARD